MESNRSDLGLVILAFVLIMVGLSFSSGILSRGTSSSSSTSTAQTAGSVVTSLSPATSSSQDTTTSVPGAGSDTSVDTLATTEGTSANPVTVDVDGTWPTVGSVVIVDDLHVLSLKPATQTTYRLSAVSDSGLTFVSATIDSAVAYQIRATGADDGTTPISLRAHYAGIENLGEGTRHALVDCSLVTTDEG